MRLEIIKSKMQFLLIVLFVIGLNPFLNKNILSAQSVLFEGNGSSIGGGTPPASGMGTRLMWFAERAAFRSGYVAGNQWDSGNIGLYSHSFGESNMAAGSHAASWGRFNQILNENGTAWGSNNRVNGSHGTVFGIFNICKNYLETVIGQFNDTSIVNNPNAFIGSDYLFVIGNGTDFDNRSNALEVYKNGNMRVGGALSLKDGIEIISSDDQVVTVGSRSYIRIGATFVVNAVDRTVVLSDGTFTGQLLLLEDSLNKWELLDVGNLNLASDHNFNIGDTIQMVWNGTKWLEVHFSDN